jgi:hypothetical protein
VSKICVVTAYNDAYTREGPLTDENKRAYCELHGYDFFSYNPATDTRLFSILGLKTRAAAWVKLFAVNRLWKDYDWVFWTDADSIIMNTSIKLETLVENLPASKVLVMPRTWEDRVTTGNFFARYSKASEDIFTRVWSMDEWAHTCDWEESALNVLIEREPALLEHIEKLPPRACNAFMLNNPWVDYKIYNKACEYRAGDFILHLLRLGPHRYEAIKSVLDGLTTIN